MECVTTHLPNAPAPKMDDAQTNHPWYAGTFVYPFKEGSECRVGGRGARVEGLKRELGWIAHPVQILVVVANIQLRTLKAEVEKVSM